MQKLIVAVALLLSACAFSQNKTRPLSLEEYQKVKTFQVADLDNDSYVKFEGKYILDRYENKKPYFITGDDGLKKRIDLYKLIAKDSLQELGVLIYYTTENGKRYTACLPGYATSGEIWRKYFEDIHAIDKEEKNFVLKLSYVLSREVGFQLYKNMNANKDMGKEEGTYGTDICFPGDMQVTMANGSRKPLSDIKTGDHIVTVDPVTHGSSVVIVKELTIHAAKNYGITSLILMHTVEHTLSTGTEISLSVQTIMATPNHPVLTTAGEKKAGEIREGDELICFNEITQQYEPYQVWYTQATVPAVQQVYNLVTDSKTLLLNGVMMLQKSLKTP